MNIEFAKSMSGHDRNQYYLIIKKEDEFVYLVNGTTKPLTKPKKKNRKHIQIIKHKSDEITGLFDGDPTDITIRKAIDASPELRSKKQLIETFIADVNDVDDVVTEWNAYVSEQREKELTQIIQEEKLKEPETRKYLANAFRDGEIKTVGTDIDKLMPPVSRFGGGGRTQKKQTVIDKLKEFFDKYFGVGGSSMSEENS